MNNLTDQLFDENNRDNIILYSETGEAVEFEQIAVIPMYGKEYVILKPAAQMPGIGEDEALVFSVETVDGEECLVITEDDDVIDQVFAEYYRLLEAAGAV